MAWIQDQHGFTWDKQYRSRAEAARRAQELSTQYGVFAEAVPADGSFEVMTKNNITESHSLVCRCEACTLHDKRNTPMSEEKKKDVLIRGVPTEVLERLSTKASGSGQDRQDYLRTLLIQASALPETYSYRVRG